MKYYYSPGACSLAGHIVALEGGLTLELEKVDLKSHVTETGADFKKINPKGYVPALVLEDGSLLTENSAILPYLGDKGGLMPDGLARNHAQEWIGFINSEVHKSFAPLFHGGSAEEKAKAAEKIKSQLALAAKALTGDYLLGSKFTPPDAYLFVMLLWCEKLRIDLSDMSALGAFKARMKARPKVAKALAEEGL